MGKRSELPQKLELSIRKINFDYNLVKVYYGRSELCYNRDESILRKNAIRADYEIYERPLNFKTVSI